MSRFQKYTVMARKSAFKYPILTAVLTQVNFWIIAYMVLAGILHNYALFINTLVDQDTGYAPVPAFLGSFIMACFYGTTLGFADYFMFRRWSSKRSVGLLIVLKGLFYLLVMSLLFVFMRKILFERFFFIYFFSPTAPFLNSENWKFFFRILGIYTLAMGLVISFINQMNSKFGPGVLIPILLGKYLKPHKEERIFMFLDLANSTTLAERLGHIKYSELIRDCFLEINRSTVKYQAEIYQYVGDEIVLSWQLSDQFNRLNCIHFYFDSMKRIVNKRDTFIETYGELPDFKAGVHEGFVTGVQVGSVKKEVAFHGDTLNVAARLQEKCKMYNSHLLISEKVANKIEWNERFQLKRYDDVLLKGREEHINIFQVDLLDKKY